VTVSILVPSLGGRSIDRLLTSLSLGSVIPDEVVVVTNEIDDLDTHGLRVRLVGFSSTEYVVGFRDIALRCNIAIHAAESDRVIFQGEDHIASRTMVADSLALLEQRRYFWGHHRYTRFGDKTVAEIVTMAPERGKSRETAANREHLFLSCYSGMLGAEKALLQEIGGFDMAFQCRHAGEDQQLGRRLSQRFDRSDRVYIFEPPFSWHPTDPDPWGEPRRINACGTHEFSIAEIDGHPYEVCANCPFRRFVGTNEELYTKGDPIVAFRPELVDLEVRIA
jgi:hypothetical protein